MKKANAEFENVVYHLTVHSIEELSFNDVLYTFHDLITAGRWVVHSIMWKVCGGAIKRAAEGAEERHEIHDGAEGTQCEQRKHQSICARLSRCSIQLLNTQTKYS